MGNCYITEVEKVDREYATSNDKVTVQFMGGTQITLRAFKTMKELDKFAKLLGFRYYLTTSIRTDRCGRVNTYEISHIINDPLSPPNYFWKLSDLPPGAQKVVLTENGSDVTCYFINTGSIIHILRPNCNAKDVYRVY